MLLDYLTKGAYGRITVGAQLELCAVKPTDLQPQLVVVQQRVIASFEHPDRWWRLLRILGNDGQ